MRRAVVLALLALVAVPAVASAKPREHRVTELVSNLPAGVEDTGVCGATRRGCEVEVTPDGRRVLFATVDGPLFEWSDGRVTAVSVGPLGTGVVGANCYPFSSKCPFRYSDDGRALTFATQTPLVAEDADARTDLYVRVGRTTDLVSTAMPTSTFAQWPYFNGMTADGHRIYYRVDSFSEEYPWLWEWTKRTGASRFPSESNPAERPEIVRDLSRDGRHVLFTTSSALVPEDDDACTDAFGARGCRDLYERTADGRIRLITGTPTVAAQGGDADVLRTSDDGRRVLFVTADALVAQDTDSCTVDGRTRGCKDIYERTSGGRFRLVSAGPLGGGGSSDVEFGDASPSWNRVFFFTSDGLVPEDVNEVADLYLRSGESLRLLASTLGGNTVQGRFLLTKDGSRLFFETRQPLAPEDQDDRIYLDPEGELFLRGDYGQDVYEWSNGEFSLVSTGPGQPYSNKDNGLIGISPDGRYVTFETYLRLLPEDTDEGLDTYVRDTRTGTTTLVSAPERDLPGHVRASSADGRRQILETDEALVPQDTDVCSDWQSTHGCDDFYEWFDGNFTLLTTGPTDDHGPCGGDYPIVCPAFAGASADATRMFFQTRQSLTPEDSDGGLNDVYLSKAVRK